ncbi:unnamed protein product [Polarella glacialis]|uniref:Uncharacterized protein n=1 Tax=Polarella glacialis TaxID=89957 RepID=A0A813K6H3_POLGL|nr:unnamed protein product [Polarella glacialis]CAE8692325.1 unnamed protein product [Polarella glacialis]
MARLQEQLAAAELTAKNTDEARLEADVRAENQAEWILQLEAELQQYAATPRSEDGHQEEQAVSKLEAECANPLSAAAAAEEARPAAESLADAHNLRIALLEAQLQQQDAISPDSLKLSAFSNELEAAPARLSFAEQARVAAEAATESIGHRITELEEELQQEQQEKEAMTKKEAEKLSKVTGQMATDESIEHGTTELEAELQQEQQEKEAMTKNIEI